MRNALLVAFAIACATRSVESQDVTPAPVKGDERASDALVTRRELLTGALFTIAAVASLPVDGRVARYSQRASLQHSVGWSRSADLFRVLGDPGSVVLSVGAYGAGVVLQNRTVADIGLHATGAILDASVITAGLKGVFGRSRPFVSGDAVPDSYQFGRGFRDGGAYQSMPSGHTTAAFALAAVISAESHARWPRHARIIASTAYAAATLAGLSRVYNNKHWMSDVLMGAGIGTVSGLATVHFQHARPGNFIDRVLLPGDRRRVPSSTRLPTTSPTTGP